jgi:hypothetical protein
MFDDIKIWLLIIEEPNYNLEPVLRNAPSQQPNRFGWRTGGIWHDETVAVKAGIAVGVDGILLRLILTLQC